MVEQNGKRPVAALFDVDGTLVDTNYLHAVTWWEAFAQAGFQVQMAQIHRAIGMGTDQMLDKLLPAGRDKDADPGLLAAHSALYSVYWSRLQPLPGAADLLRACKRRDLAVVLASSAGEPEFGVLRAALDAEDAIDAATFSGDVESTKPAPDLVQAALAKAARRPPRPCSSATRSGTCKPARRPACGASACSAVASAARSSSQPGRPRSTATRQTCWPPWTQACSATAGSKRDSGFQ